jgi:oligoribonuclease (3'-5' exoribonuclease)
MEDAESAVLDAARKWVAAKEAILAADEVHEDDQIATEGALDQAEYELTDAVYRLLGREPRLPHRE